MPPDLDAWKSTVRKLGDNAGYYMLELRCACGHVAQLEPREIAERADWDTPLDEIAKRARCTQCKQRGATTWDVDRIRRQRWRTKV